jgi:hypothetical protein
MNGSKYPLLKAFWVMVNVKTGQLTLGGQLGRNIQYKKETIKIVQMKKLAFITGALSISLTGLGIIFKMNYWPAASMLIVVGIGIFSLLFTPSIFKYF